MVALPSNHSEIVTVKRRTANHAEHHALKCTQRIKKSKLRKQAKRNKAVDILF